MNNNQDNVNVYIEFLLFTVILTTIISLFYMPIFKVTNPEGYRSRIIRIFIASCIIYYLFKRLSASILKKHLDYSPFSL